MIDLREVIQVFGGEVHFKNFPDHVAALIMGKLFAIDELIRGIPDSIGLQTPDVTALRKPI